MVLGTWSIDRAAAELEPWVLEKHYQTQARPGGLLRAEMTESVTMCIFIPRKWRLILGLAIRGLVCLGLQQFCRPSTPPIIQRPNDLGSIAKNAQDRRPRPRRRRRRCRREVVHRLAQEAQREVAGYLRCRDQLDEAPEENSRRPNRSTNATPSRSPGPLRSTWKTGDMPIGERRHWRPSSKAFADGAVAVKVWKEIGMVLKDPDGHWVMIDDPRFDPRF